MRLYLPADDELQTMVPGTRAGQGTKDDWAYTHYTLGEARVTGTCNVVDEFVTCGIGFGTTNFTLDVGAPLEERYFRHTMNVTGIVPEPSTGLLLAAGLLSLARRRR